MKEKLLTMVCGVLALSAAVLGAYTFKRSEEMALQRENHYAKSIAILESNEPVYEPESELKTAVAGERIMLRTQGQDEDYDINAGVTGELVKTIVEEETEETTESLP